MTCKTSQIKLDLKRYKVKENHTLVKTVKTTNFKQNMKTIKQEQ